MLKVVGTESAKDEGAGRSQLDEIAREGARLMLVETLETEVAAYLEAHRDERDAAGHALVVRNGKGRTRKVTVGSGTIAVSAPRVNDRRMGQEASGEVHERILPPYLRRSPKVAAVLPVLYLRGLSTGDFREALPALLGERRPGCPHEHHAADQRVGGRAPRLPKRDLADATTCTCGPTASTLTCALEDDRLCRWSCWACGRRTKELVAARTATARARIAGGPSCATSSAAAWRARWVAVGDGALGFWAAVRNVWPETPEQRCLGPPDWRTSSTSYQGTRARAKQVLHEVMGAETRALETLSALARSEAPSTARSTRRQSRRSAGDCWEMSG